MPTASVAETGLYPSAFVRRVERRGVHGRLTAADHIQDERGMPVADIRPATL
jgi:hypothetical protein